MPSKPGKTKQKRNYGNGRIRERNGRFYLRYYDKDGTRQEEPAGTDRGAAERLLKQRVGEAAAGYVPHAAVRKAGGDVTIEDCLRLHVKDLERRKKPSAKLYEYQIDTAFRPILKKKAVNYSYEDAWRFIESRRAEGCKDSTIGRDLSQLRSALRLAAKAPHRLIGEAPAIPNLDPGDNVRTGFLTPAQYTALMGCLPEHLKAITCFGYLTGLRKRTLSGLRLSQIDLKERLIWVNKRQVKNRESHTVPILEGEMLKYTLIALQNNKEFIFEQCDERRGRRPLNDFRRAWTKAVVLAGMPDLTFHDLRRTAVKDWIATGAPESSVMAISGHKTHTMLRRYNIINAAVVQQVARLRNAVIAEEAAQEKEKMGEKMGEKSSSLPS
jgi:integrase